jgi:putative Holliday junction resolvase
MPRILAIDFGEKRIGLATCDATGQVVAARRTLLRKSDAAAVEEIGQFCSNEEVEAVVVGIPRSPEGIESPFAARVRSFAAKLGKRLDVPIDYHEETLTSWEAQHAEPHQTREEIDRSAAALILADYLATSAARGRT